MQITKEKLNEVEGELRNSVAKADTDVLKELENAISSSNMEEIVKGSVSGWELGQKLIVSTLDQLELSEKIPEVRMASLELVVRHVLAMGIKAGIALAEAEQLRAMLGGVDENNS